MSGPQGNHTPSSPYLSLSSTDPISGASELNFNEKIIWNWKCKIIKSSIKSNEKFNESRKGGLSETHQSERLGAAPPAWANGKPPLSYLPCLQNIHSSVCLSLALPVAWTATVQQVEQNDALQCFSQPPVHTLTHTFWCQHTCIPHSIQTHLPAH